MPKPVEPPPFVPAEVLRAFGWKLATRTDRDTLWQRDGRPVTEDMALDICRGEWEFWARKGRRV